MLRPPLRRSFTGSRWPAGKGTRRAFPQLSDGGDDRDRHPLVLSESEQAEPRGDVGGCAEIARELNRGLPGCGGLNLFVALELLAREGRR